MLSSDDNCHHVTLIAIDPEGIHNRCDLWGNKNSPPHIYNSSGLGLTTDSAKNAQKTPRTVY